MVAMMDTLAIYEQFRAVLGEERAKGFAQTLGTMIEEAKNAATKEDIRLLRESLETGTSRLDAALEKLAEAQVQTEARLGRLEATVEKLAEAQVRTEARLGRLEATVEKLAEAQVQTEARLGRLEATVEKLAEAQVQTEARLSRLEETVAKLAEAQVQTEARLGRLEATVEKLAEAQLKMEARLGRLEATVEKLAEAQVQTEARLSRLEEVVERLAKVVERLVVRSDRHEGTLLELRFRDRLPSYLGLFLRRAKVLQPADLLDDLEPRLERAEVEDFLRADVLARGAVDGETTYVVGEVSYTAHASDVDRAARRAGLLRKAELHALGLVACETVQPETLAYAREQGVRVWSDGRFVDERPA